MWQLISEPGFLKYVVAPVFLLLILLINLIKRRYEFIDVKANHIIISRLLMLETPCYIEDIVSISIKDFRRNKANIVIKLKNKQLNFHRVDFQLYNKLIKFSKENSITLCLENSSGVIEKMN